MGDDLTHGDGLAPAGSLATKVIRGNVDSELAAVLAGRPVPAWPCEPSVREIIEYGLPQSGLSETVNRYRRANARHLWRGARRVLAQRMLPRPVRLPAAFGALYATVLRADGQVDELGLISLQLVTTAGVGFIVDAFQNIVELETMKFHGLGTGTNAEATGDTALQTEITTAYNPDSTRATGTTTEASANVYRTVATNTVDGAAAVTEHGILSQAATGGGVLLDRSVFSVINLASGDGLQTTYDFTVAAGG